MANEATKQNETSEKLIALVVDDMPDMRAHLCQLVGELEIQTVEGTNGVEAIDLLGSQQVDLVVTDLVMPEMDGFEL